MFNKLLCLTQKLVYFKITTVDLMTHFATQYLHWRTSKIARSANSKCTGENADEGFVS